MPRPPEHPEQHLSTPERARARYLVLHPGRAELLDWATLGVASFEVSRWRLALQDWLANCSAVLESLPMPPDPLLPDTRHLVEHLGGELALALRVDDLARRSFEEARRVAAEEVLRSGRVDVHDSRALTAYAAVVACHQRGWEMKPRDLVLLEVAVGADQPTGDVGEYERRLDAAGERLRRARAAFEARVSPEPSASE